MAISPTIAAAMALQRITDAGDRSLILILSDINMPGMSGLELLPKARAARPDIPIIMITAYGDAKTKRMALESGAEALLTKPINVGLLRNEIDMRIERAAYPQAVYGRWPLAIRVMSSNGRTALIKLSDIAAVQESAYCP